MYYYWLQIFLYINTHKFWFILKKTKIINFEIIICLIAAKMSSRDNLWKII